MKPPNCTAKEFFVIKESRPVRNATKRIKQILDAEYKKINLQSIIMNLDYLKDKHRNSLLELLQKCKNNGLKSPLTSQFMPNSMSLSNTNFPSKIDIYMIID